MPEPHGRNCFHGRTFSGPENGRANWESKLGRRGPAAASPSPSLEDEEEGNLQLGKMVAYSSKMGSVINPFD